MEYTILVEKDTKSGWYSGQCVQLPAAISQGETLAELMDNMKDAISLVLDYNKEQLRKNTNGKKSFYRKLAMV